MVNLVIHVSDKRHLSTMHGEQKIKTFNGVPIRGVLWVILKIFRRIKVGRVPQRCVVDYDYGERYNNKKNNRIL
jgi:hypothetical protein